MGAPVVEDDDIVVGINVTPLVDVTLVLLIVFIVTAKLAAQQGVPMDLPKAATASASQSVLTVAVDGSGSISIDGAAVSDVDLRARSKRALAENPQTRVVVQAAGAAKHEHVLHAVDELRQSGVVRIAFAAERRAPPGSGR